MFKCFTLAILLIILSFSGVSEGQGIFRVHMPADIPSVDIVAVDPVANVGLFNGGLISLEIVSLGSGVEIIEISIAITMDYDVNSFPIPNGSGTFLFPGGDLLTGTISAWAVTDFDTFPETSCSPFTCDWYTRIEIGLNPGQMFSGQTYDLFRIEGMVLPLDTVTMRPCCEFPGSNFPPGTAQGFTGNISTVVRAFDSNLGVVVDLVDFTNYFGPTAEEVTYGAPQDQFVRGDANDDGSIDITDPVKIFEILFQGGQADCLLSCDVNDDEQVDIADPVYLLDFLFGFPTNPPPPPPFPTNPLSINPLSVFACGLDTTIAPLFCNPGASLCP